MEKTPDINFRPLHTHGLAYMPTCIYTCTICIYNVHICIWKKAKQTNKQNSLRPDLVPCSVGINAHPKGVGYVSWDWIRGWEWVVTKCSASSLGITNAFHHTLPSTTLWCSIRPSAEVAAWLWPLFNHQIHEWKKPLFFIKNPLVYFMMATSGQRDSLKCSWLYPWECQYQKDENPKVVFKGTQNKHLSWHPWPHHEE